MTFGVFSFFFFFFFFFLINSSIIGTEYLTARFTSNCSFEACNCISGQV